MFAIFFKRISLMRVGWLVLLGTLNSAAPGLAQSQETLDAQLKQYQAVQAKSVVDIQPFRNTVTIDLGPDNGQLRLISLNPNVNSWFLIQRGTKEDPDQESYHLENPFPAHQSVELSAGPQPGLIVTYQDSVKRCNLWQGDPSALRVARDTGLPYAPVCNGRLFLRNKVSGSRTNLEATTEFLRDHVWGGERLVNLVKNSFFQDSELETADLLGADGGTQEAYGPGAAQIRETFEERPVISARHGLTLTGTEPGRMTVGLWYPLTGLPGVYASAYQPRLVSQEILKGPGKANYIDSVEGGATAYMVAFEMSRFDIGYAIGTTHPALNWSPRPPAYLHPPGLRGPDGFRTPSPLVRLGMVSPPLAGQTIATFTGGFKREHGAFRYGDYATIDLGKHYGFIENGVIWSKLHTKLSTFYVLTDGTIGMTTWTEEDNALLPHIRFARQNGVPLVVTDPQTGRNMPGDRVTQWGPGNWSGSAEAKLRTVRAGACMKEYDDKQYLIYGYFSTATPSAMARTFQAYGCNYAMLLDMNALEHTYLAVYAHANDQVHVQHLIPGMRAVDKQARDGNVIPRFLGFADNRDFFYLTLKGDGP